MCKFDTKQTGSRYRQSAILIGHPHAGRATNDIFTPYPKSSYCSVSPDASNRWSIMAMLLEKLIENEGVNGSGSPDVRFSIRPDFKIIR